MRVPAGVYVEEQRTETELLLGHQGDVGAVDTTADPDQAVMIPAPSVTPNLVNEGGDELLANLIRMPVRDNAVTVVVAVVTPATRVERNLRIGRVHDAVGADRVWAR